MAFVSHDQTKMDPGKAVKSEVFKQTADNEDDLDSRVTTLEGGANKVNIMSGSIRNSASFSTATGLCFTPANFAFTLLSCVITIREVGSFTGSIEIDIQRSTSRDFTSANSIFTTQPAVNYSTASDYDDSSGHTAAVFDAGEINIGTGDWFRLDITSSASPVQPSFEIEFIGEVN